ncbi:hypothetical protein J6590_039345 [Homalodisca vitripennis]|nr:hypothetical protein J6590_039345 [Homalodisca vitripennis]
MRRRRSGAAVQSGDNRLTRKAHVNCQGRASGTELGRQTRCISVVRGAAVELQCKRRRSGATVQSGDNRLTRKAHVNYRGRASGTGLGRQTRCISVVRGAAVELQCKVETID